MMPHGHHASSRLCFWAGTLWVGAATVMLGMSVDWPVVPRIIAVGVIGAALLIGLTEGLRWISHEAGAQAVPQPPAQSSPPTPTPPHDNTFRGPVPPGMAAG